MSDIIYAFIENEKNGSFPVEKYAKNWRPEIHQAQGKRNSIICQTQTPRMHKAQLLSADLCETTNIEC